MPFQQSEEEFKLPLRQWLMHKIKQKRFEGLEWEDEHQQLFKIPWTQKGHPNWEKHYEIFIAWAKHRGNYDENHPPDDKKLKGNFRCALNKSDDFEELKAESKTNQQMGNYKLFRLLTSQEVKAKRESRRRKRPHPPSNATPAAHNSLEMPDQKKAAERSQSPTYLEKPTMENYNGNEIAETYLNLPPPSNAGISFADVTELNSFQLKPPIPVEQSHFELTPGVLQGAAPPQPLDDTLGFIDDILVSPGPAPCNEVLDPEPTSPEDGLPCQSFEEFLNKFRINSSQLSRFNVIIRYENAVVAQGELDLSKGIRLMYGSYDKQKTILDVFGKNLTDFDFIPIQLPVYIGSNSRVMKILQLADLGIVLKLDNNKTVLRGTRYSQSQVFYFDSNDGTSTKMIRKKQIELFSYLKCIRNSIKCQMELTSGRIDTEIVLVVGTHPSHSRSASLVSVVLEPVVAPQLREHFGLLDHSSLLAISQQNSLDQLVRMLDDFDVGGFGR